MVSFLSFSWYGLTVIFCSGVWNMSTQLVSCTVISSLVTSWSMKTATWRFAISVWPGFKTRRWPVTCRHDTTALRRSCLHGKSTMWRSTFGVPGAFSQRCSMESHYFPERIMSTNFPLSPNCWARRPMMWSRPSAVRMCVCFPRCFCVIFLGLVEYEADCYLFRLCDSSSLSPSGNANPWPIDSRMPTPMVRTMPDWHSV